MLQCLPSAGICYLIIHVHKQKFLSVLGGEPVCSMLLKQLNTNATMDKISRVCTFIVASTKYFSQTRLRSAAWRDQYDIDSSETVIMFDRKRLVLCKYKLYSTGRHWSGWRGARATKSTSLMPLPRPFLAPVSLKMNINQSLRINLLLYIELLNFYIPCIFLQNQILLT